MQTSHVGSPSWAEKEFAGADIGDRRLNRRLVKSLRLIAENPSASLPRALPKGADLKGCYRLLSSTKLTPDKIRSPHQASTLERCADHEVVILALDITSIDFTTRKSVRELGYLDQPYLRGILVPTALASSVDGTPLGVLEQHIWIRPVDVSALLGAM